MEFQRIRVLKEKIFKTVCKVSCSAAGYSDIVIWMKVLEALRG